MSIQGSPDVPALLKTWYGNLTRNTSEAFTNLTAKNAIRLVIIVCAYALIIRPVLVRIGARIQAKQHADANKENFLAQRTKRVAIPGVDSDSDEDEEGVKADVKAGEWGRKARLRQRGVVRRLLEEKEKRGLEDESDDEIKEFLHD